MHVVLYVKSCERFRKLDGVSSGVDGALFGGSIKSERYKVANLDTWVLLTLMDLVERIKERLTRQVA